MRQSKSLITENTQNTNHKSENLLEMSSRQKNKPIKTKQEQLEKSKAKLNQALSIKQKNSRKKKTPKPVRPTPQFEENSTASG